MKFATIVLIATAGYVTSSSVVSRVVDIVKDVSSQEAQPMQAQSVSHASNSSACVKSTRGSCFKDHVMVDFESPKYTTGNINGQDGWKKTGAFDVAVVSQTLHNSFGRQSLRISDAVTSGSFADQTYAKPLGGSVGESGSTAGTFTQGTKYKTFEVRFDIASTKSTLQPGLHATMSPDRGDGSRMSALRFVDSAAGIVVVFNDVQGMLAPGDPACAPSTRTCANFVDKIVGKLDRRRPHSIKLVVRTVNGPSNDVVEVYIDGKRVHVGTSWEDYYRYDPESVAEMTPRIIKTVLFRQSGIAVPADNGFGFLIDNLVMGAY